MRSMNLHFRNREGATSDETPVRKVAAVHALDHIHLQELCWAKSGMSIFSELVLPCGHMHGLESNPEHPHAGIALHNPPHFPSFEV